MTDEIILGCILKSSVSLRVFPFGLEVNMSVKQKKTSLLKMISRFVRRQLHLSVILLVINEVILNFHFLRIPIYVTNGCKGTKYFLKETNYYQLKLHSEVFF